MSGMKFKTDGHQDVSDGEDQVNILAPGSLYNKNDSNDIKKDTTEENDENNILLNDKFQKFAKDKDLHQQNTFSMLITILIYI
jgi:hypothetical protein